MKKAINLRAFPEKMGIQKCLHLAKAAGFEGFEPNMDEGGEISENSTKKQMEGIRDTASKVGIELTSLCTKEFFFKASLTDDNPKVRDKAENWIRKMLELASYAKLDTVLIVPGSVGMPGYSLSPVPYEVAYQRSFESLKGLIPIAEKYRVNMSLETIMWNKFLLSPLEMRDFVDKFQSEYVSIYFDVGNVQPFGYPEHWIRIFGKRIRRVHLKEFSSTAGGFGNPIATYVGFLEGDTNWPNVIRALSEVNYDGYLTAEPLEPLMSYPDHLIYQTSAAMDKILQR